jgi:hypothetical protein
MSVRRVLIGLLLALGAASTPLALAAPPAAAQDPVDLGSGHVVDQAGVLSHADTATIEAAAAALYKDHRIDLYVVYVDRFTNPTDAEDWANETAARNNLGSTDYLLAVATDGRAYYLSGDSSGPVSDEKLSGIEQNQIEPKLRTHDWTQAAVAAASGLGDAMGGGGPGAYFWVLLVGVIVIGVVVLLLVRWRVRGAKGGGAGGRGGPGGGPGGGGPGGGTGGGPGPGGGPGSGPSDGPGPGAGTEPAALPGAELERRADSALVQTDDAIRTSEEEREAVHPREDLPAPQGRRRRPAPRGPVLRAAHPGPVTR